MKKTLIAFLLMFSISSLIYAQGNKIGENIENFKTILTQWNNNTSHRNKNNFLKN